MDFLKIRWREGKTKKQPPEIYPTFDTIDREDLMTRGGKFYALWDEDRKIWTTKERDARKAIDKELIKYQKEHPEIQNEYGKPAKVLLLRDSSSRSIDDWKKYCEKQAYEYYYPLDEKLVFANQEPVREDYSTKRLSYSLAEGPYPAWEEVIGTLYSPSEKHKIEWAIGSIITGDSKKNQKFLVFYGAGGTGKSTVLNIIKDRLFKGYSCAFTASALCSGGNQFALEPFKNHPLVAVDPEGDLSRIENNTYLNALVAHDETVVNTKYASLFSAAFHAMLFVGTNKPVKITDAKSGVIRRLIDVRPTGNRIPKKKFDRLLNQIEFELGAIAWHCREVYLEDPEFYDDYVPQEMIGATNDFYNFVEEYALEFKMKDSTTLNYAWTKYKQYIQDARVPYPYSQRVFKEELKNYFRDFYPRKGTGANRQWNFYEGFLWDKFRQLFDEEDIREFEKESGKHEEVPVEAEDGHWIELEPVQESIFDVTFKDCPAQYAVETEDGSDRPERGWDKCRTKLKDIRPDRLHYVKVPGNLIMIDFDLRDPDTGEKSLVRNIQAAEKFPPTYAEVSRSGGGLHLYYFYDGDVNKLSRIYGDNIEVKVFPDEKLATVRRALTQATVLMTIATISSGLPLKEESKVIDFEGLKDQMHLINRIRKYMKNHKSKDPDIHLSTSQAVSLIHDTLEEAYQSGISYDIRPMQGELFGFCANSSHQAQQCIRKFRTMKLCSKDILEGEELAKKDAESEYDKLCFFDCEVFKNLIVFVFKVEGCKPVILINPTPKDMEPWLKYKLVGFNCRKYDNQIIYAIMNDYGLYDCYKLSQLIIVDQRKDVMWVEAYDISALDLWDLATNKQGLKKWEIEMDIHHQELGIPWDQEVPKELWKKVAEYCVNDVEATEALYYYLLDTDVRGRMILSEVSELSPNHTNNQHTAQIIFEDNRHPQDEFVYTDLSEMFPGYEFDENGIDRGRYLAGTKIVSGKSIYMGEDPGEGGYVYAEPGIWHDVALLDIASMHPTSIIQLNLFGDRYTKRFEDLVKARLYIKHGEYDKAGELFDGKLSKYLDNKDNAKALSQALKIPINSVYGLTSATFPNQFKDPRNIDNIVAKRGALFMITLKNEVQKLGYRVAHIKTDSIKIPDATPEIISFVMEFGKRYGYTFEHEATYEKMCLVNDAVYIAKYADGAHEYKLSTGEKIMTPWTATGKQFMVPYVFKTLFSDSPILFKDLCETMSVTTALYLDFNEGMPEDEHHYVFVGRVGQFCPLVDGAGGGILLRVNDDGTKYSAATGSKGYRWMESEAVRNLEKEDLIDRGYYRAKVDTAIETISQYGNFEEFAS